MAWQEVALWPMLTGIPQHRQILIHWRVRTRIYCLYKISLLDGSIRLFVCWACVGAVPQYNHMLVQWLRATSCSVVLAWGAVTVVGSGVTLPNQNSDFLSQGTIKTTLFTF